MPKMVEHTAAEILAMSRDELKLLRRTFFKHTLPREYSREKLDAFLEFISRFTIVQDMREWSHLAEPGMASFLIDEEDFSDQDMEDARELDRNSLELHSEVTQEFEKGGGRKGFQEAIVRLNSLC